MLILNFTCHSVIVCSYVLNFVTFIIKNLNFQYCGGLRTLYVLRHVLSSTLNSWVWTVWKMSIVLTRIKHRGNWSMQRFSTSLVRHYWLQDCVNFSMVKTTEHTLAILDSNHIADNMKKKYFNFVHLPYSCVNGR